MSKTRLIPGWAGNLVSRAIDRYAPMVAGLISSPEIRMGVMLLFGRVTAIITAISDRNPQNAEQVESIIREFVSEDAIGLADNVISERIGRIPSDRTRNTLTLLAAPVVDTLRILTDDDPDNAAQAEIILDDFILNPAVQELIIEDLTIPVLENVVKDPVLLSFILEALETGVAQGAITLANIDVFTAARERADTQILD